jgi:hypothetical protein
MKTTILLVGALLAAPMAVSAQSPFALAAGWSEVRGRGESGRDGGGAWLNLQRGFGAVHAVELEYQRAAFDEGSRNLVSVHWVQTNPEPLWRPFFLLGLGISDGAGGSGALASVGIGGRWQLLPGTLDLRADLRFQHDSAGARGSRNEGVLLIGLSLPLGR